MTTFNLTARLNVQGPFGIKPVVDRLKRQVQGINADVNVRINPKANTEIKNLNNSLTQLEARLKNISSLSASASNNLNKLGGAFSKASTSSNNQARSQSSANAVLAKTARGAAEAASEMEEFGRVSGLAIRRFAGFTVATGVIFGFINAVQDATKEAISFERELAKVAQVSGVSLSGLKDLTDEISRLATGFGVSSSELLTASRTLKQAGFSATETRKSLEAIAKTDLAPTFDSIATTTEGAIAVLQQFGLEASDLESVLGSINRVAGQFAVESGDIIAAIRRAGGVFSAAAGTEGTAEAEQTVREFIALFTSVRATTRETAESIAVGLRTVFSRLQRGTTIDSLKKLGIELTDLEGKFVGPFEAVKRLNEGLQGLDTTDIRFAAIVEELGGIRQIGKIIPLIKQFATAQNALQSAQEGTNSLAIDAAVAQDTLQNKIVKTKERFLELIREITQTDTFKFLAGSVLFLANSFISLADAFKPVLPLIAAFAAFKGLGAAGRFVTGFRRGVTANSSGASEALAGNVAGAGRSAQINGLSQNTAAINQNTGSQNQQTTTNRASANAQVALVNAMSANSAALSLNTSALTRLAGLLGSRSFSVNPRRRNMGGPIRRFARGGKIPGSTESDTVDIKAMPGEFILNKKAVDKVGEENLQQLNRGGSATIFKPELKNVRAVRAEPEKLFKRRGMGGDIKRLGLVSGGIAKIRKELRDSLPTAFGPGSSGGLSGEDQSGFLLERGRERLLTDPNTRKRRADELKRIRKVKTEIKQPFGVAFLRPENFTSNQFGVASVNGADVGFQLSAGSLKSDLSEKVEDKILSGVVGSINDGARLLRTSIGIKSKRAKVDADFLKKINIDQITGNIYEGILARTGAPYAGAEKDSGNAPFDFPSGLGAVANSFTNSTVLSAGIVDAKATATKKAFASVNKKARNVIQEASLNLETSQVGKSRAFNPKLKTGGAEQIEVSTGIPTISSSLSSEKTARRSKIISKIEEQRALSNINPVQAKQFVSSIIQQNIVKNKTRGQAITEIGNRVNRPFLASLGLPNSENAQFNDVKDFVLKNPSLFPGLENLRESTKKKKALGGRIKLAMGGSLKQDVPVALTPGELVFDPGATQKAGVKALERFNSSGDATKIPKMASGGSVSMVPGVGNTDSFYTTLKEGSFVIKKKSAEKAMAQGFNKGGRVSFGRGGRLMPQKFGGGGNILRQRFTKGGEIDAAALRLPIQTQTVITPQLAREAQNSIKDVTKNSKLQSRAYEVYTKAIRDGATAEQAKTKAVQFATKANQVIQNRRNERADRFSRISGNLSFAAFAATPLIQSAIGDKDPTSAGIGGGISGGLIGATTGAQLGSIAGIPGTIVGGIIGGLGGAFSGYQNSIDEASDKIRRQDLSSALDEATKKIQAFEFGKLDNDQFIKSINQLGNAADSSTRTILDSTKIGSTGSFDLTFASAKFRDIFGAGGGNNVQKLLEAQTQQEAQRIGEENKPQVEEIIKAIELGINKGVFKDFNSILSSLSDETLIAIGSTDKYAAAVAVSQKELGNTEKAFEALRQAGINILAPLNDQFEVLSNINAVKNTTRAVSLLNDRLDALSRIATIASEAGNNFQSQIDLINGSISSINIRELSGTIDVINDADFNKIKEGITGFFGDNNTTRELNTELDNARKLSRLTPSIAAEVASKSSINTEGAAPALRKILEREKIGGDIGSKITAILTEKLNNDRQGGFEDTRDQIEKGISEAISGYTEAVTKGTDALTKAQVDALNGFISNANLYSNAIKEATNKIQQVSDLRIDRSTQLKEALGQETSVQDVFNDLISKVNVRSSIGGIGNVSNPDDIANEIRALRAQNAKLNEARIQSAQSGDSDAFIANTDAINKNIRQQESLENAIDLLATDVSALTKVESELAKLQRQRDEGRNLLQRIAKAAVDPKEAEELSKDAFAANVLRFGGPVNGEIIDRGTRFLQQYGEISGRQKDVTQGLDNAFLKIAGLNIGATPQGLDILRGFTIGQDDREQELVQQFNALSALQEKAITSQSDLLKDNADAIRKAGTDIIKEIKESFNKSFKEIEIIFPDVQSNREEGGLSDAAKSLGAEGAAGALTNSANLLSEAAKSLAAFQARLPVGDVGGPPAPTEGFRSGGFISGGPYNATKDTIPAMLQPGEFVVRREVAQKNGPLLQSLNSGGKVAGFMHGGIIGGWINKVEIVKDVFTIRGNEQFTLDSGGNPDVIGKIDNLFGDDFAVALNTLDRVLGIDPNARRVPSPVSGTVENNFVTRALDSNEDPAAKAVSPQNLQSLINLYSEGDRSVPTKFVIKIAGIYEEVDLREFLEARRKATDEQTRKAIQEDKKKRPERYGLADLPPATIQEGGLTNEGIIQSILERTSRDSNTTVPDSSSILEGGMSAVPDNASLRAKTQSIINTNSPILSDHMYRSIVGVLESNHNNSPLKGSSEQQRRLDIEKELAENRFFPKPPKVSPTSDFAGDEFVGPIQQLINEPQQILEKGASERSRDNIIREKFGDKGVRNAAINREIIRYNKFLENGNEKEFRIYTNEFGRKPNFTTEEIEILRSEIERVNSRLPEDQAAKLKPFKGTGFLFVDRDGPQQDVNENSPAILRIKEKKNEEIITKARREKADFEAANPIEPTPLQTGRRIVRATNRAPISAGVGAPGVQEFETVDLAPLATIPQQKPRPTFQFSIEALDAVTELEKINKKQQKIREFLQKGLTLEQIQKIIEFDEKYRNQIVPKDFEEAAIAVPDPSGEFSSLQAKESIERQRQNTRNTQSITNRGISLPVTFSSDEETPQQKVLKDLGIQVTQNPDGSVDAIQTNTKILDLEQAALQKKLDIFDKEYPNEIFPKDFEEAARLANDVGDTNIFDLGVSRYKKFLNFAVEAIGRVASKRIALGQASPEEENARRAQLGLPPAGSIFVGRANRVPPPERELDIGISRKLARGQELDDDEKKKLKEFQAAKKRASLDATNRRLSIDISRKIAKGEKLEPEEQQDFDNFKKDAGIPSSGSFISRSKFTREQRLELVELRKKKREEAFELVKRNRTAAEQARIDKGQRIAGLRQERIDQARLNREEFEAGAFDRAKAAIEQTQIDRLLRSGNIQLAEDQEDFVGPLLPQQENQVSPLDNIRQLSRSQRIRAFNAQRLGPRTEASQKALIDALRSGKTRRVGSTRLQQPEPLYFVDPELTRQLTPNGGIIDPKNPNNILGTYNIPKIVYDENGNPVPNPYLPTGNPVDAKRAEPNRVLGPISRDESRRPSLAPGSAIPFRFIPDEGQQLSPELIEMNSRRSDIDPNTGRRIQRDEGTRNLLNIANDPSVRAGVQAIQNYDPSGDPSLFYFNRLEEERRQGAILVRRIRGFANGGSVDTVPAMLQPGEFVVNKDAAARNMAFLQKLNGGEIQGFAKGGVVGYQTGGTVSPAISTGGVNLTELISPQAISSMNSLVGAFGVFNSTSSDLASAIRSLGDFALIASSLTRAAEGLRNLIIPDTIQLQVAPIQVNASVSVVGADENVQKLKEGLEAIVKEKVREAINKNINPVTGETSNNFLQNSG